MWPGPHSSTADFLKYLCRRFGGVEIKMSIITLKKSNCRSCFKCGSHCPVKSIRFTGDGACIIADECILCGNCFVVCPQDAKQISSELERVKGFLRDGEQVFVSLAPSFVSNYENVGIDEISFALTRMGFAGVEETAIGATIVKNEYERILREEKRDVVISSCCHSVNLLVQKYFPSLVDCLADVMSPMLAHCRQIKETYPDAKCVFVGPCISKKDEATSCGGIVDAVLTFDELSAWLREENVDLDKEAKKITKSRARLFPTVGGILDTMNCTEEGYAYLTVDGVENCMDALRDIEAGLLHSCFIEMSGCNGSCLNGPVMAKNDRSLVRDCKTIRDFAGEEDFFAEYKQDSVKREFKPIRIDGSMPSEAEIREILLLMGKTTKEDELDCGSCGYDTCREKAISVCRGKSEPSACLPLLRKKAENFSDILVKTAPSGIIVLNEDLEIQKINEEAEGILCIPASRSVIGEPLREFIDDISPFMAVKFTGKNIIAERCNLARYDKCVVQNIVYDRDDGVIVCFMRDVTEDEREREKKEALSRQTVEVADRVVERQMRIVQEIASLLGETAAETKIALTKLKESLNDE